MQDSSATQISHQPARAHFLPQAAILAIIFATWFLIYVPGLSRPGLLDDADSIHAEASREMLLNHNWVTLYINGIRYLEKAPLMYWAVAISYKLFGVGEWQTRLPLSLGVLALAWAAFIFGRRYLGEEAGFYAALILVTAPGIYVYTRFLIPDVVVAMWLTLGLYLFLLRLRARAPFALAMLGHRRHDRAQRFDKKPDRYRLSRDDHFRFSASRRKFQKTPARCIRGLRLWFFSPSPRPGTFSPPSAAPLSRAAPKKAFSGFIS